MDNPGYDQTPYIDAELQTGPWGDTIEQLTIEQYLETANASCQVLPNLEPPTDKTLRRLAYYKRNAFPVLARTVGDVEIRRSAAPINYVDELGDPLTQQEIEANGYPLYQTLVCCFDGDTCVAYFDYVKAYESCEALVNPDYTGLKLSAHMMLVFVRASPFPKTKFMTPAIATTTRMAFDRLQREAIAGEWEDETHPDWVIS